LRKRLEKRLKDVWGLYVKSQSLIKEYQERLDKLENQLLAKSQPQYEQQTKFHPLLPNDKPTEVNKENPSIGSDSTKKRIKRVTIVTAINDDEEVDLFDDLRNKDEIVIESSIPLLGQETQSPYLPQPNSSEISMNNHGIMMNSLHANISKFGDQRESPDLLFYKSSHSNNESVIVSTMPSKSKRDSPVAEENSIHGSPELFTPYPQNAATTTTMPSPVPLKGFSRSMLPLGKEPIIEESSKTVTSLNKELGGKEMNRAQPLKYQEVVRGKAARAALPGGCCDECRTFYTSLAATIHPGENIQLVMDRYSRHRHRHEAPSTPDGYWDLWSLPEESQPITKQQTAFHSGRPAGELLRVSTAKPGAAPPINDLAKGHTAMKPSVDDWFS
jgi:hypothetical protein